MTAQECIERTRRWRKWVAIWRSEGTDWRSALTGVPRVIGQRHRDGFIRVADSCETESFQRAA